MKRNVPPNNPNNAGFSSSSHRPNNNNNNNMVLPSGGASVATKMTSSNGTSSLLNRRRGTSTRSRHNNFRFSWESPFTLLLFVGTGLTIGLLVLFLAYGTGNSKHPHRIQNLMSGLKRRIQQQKQPSSSHDYKEHVYHSHEHQEYHDHEHEHYEYHDHQDHHDHHEQKQQQHVYHNHEHQEHHDHEHEHNEHHDHDHDLDNIDLGGLSAEEMHLQMHHHDHDETYNAKDFYAKGDPQIAHVKKFDSLPTNLYPYSLDLIPSGYNIEQEYNHVVDIQRYNEYTTGERPYLITNDIIEQSNQQARSRRVYIKQSMQYVWQNYIKYAYGKDEFKPHSGQGENNWGGLGVTLIDTLDTLWMMDMTNEFNQAKEWVRDHFDCSVVGNVNVYETTKRVLGGLLSAYDWSQDIIFLQKAYYLGERLLPSFENSPSGIPSRHVSLSNGIGNSGATGHILLSEFGAIQVEFKYLAHATNHLQLSERTDQVFKIMHSITPKNGLLPYLWKNHGGEDNKPLRMNEILTMGGPAGSYYAYMLKLWIQSDQTIPMYREMYDAAMDGMHNELLRYSIPSGLKYLADKDLKGKMDEKMDHRTCQLGGVLALGAYTDPKGLESDRAQRDLQTAKALTYTCYQMYARMNTGLSPEDVRFELGRDLYAANTEYQLRADVVESFFILHSLTNDPIYRQWGWEIYQSIEKYCKTEYGYGTISNVQDTKQRSKDNTTMESYFLSATLKYLYLLQDPDKKIDIIHQHVFTTGGHALRHISKMSSPITMQK
jgi:Glycosyl hydrolase family 47